MEHGDPKTLSSVVQLVYNRFEPTQVHAPAIFFSSDPDLSSLSKHVKHRSKLTALIPSCQLNELPKASETELGSKY